MSTSSSFFTTTKSRRGNGELKLWSKTGSRAWTSWNSVYKPTVLRAKADASHNSTTVSSSALALHNTTCIRFQEKARSRWVCVFCKYITTRPVKLAGAQINRVIKLSPLCSLPLFRFAIRQPTLTQRSWERLRLHRDPDRDNKDEGIFKIQKGKLSVNCCPDLYDGSILDCEIRLWCKFQRSSGESASVQLFFITERKKLCW